MKTFDEIQFNPDQCRQELAELQSLLASSPDLKEAQHILPFFRERRHLSVFLGSSEPGIIHYDRIAYEYDLFGDYVCDLVVGDSVTRTYGFIEFEDAASNSIFVPRGARAAPEWSPRFEHGYSQIIDWFHKLDDMGRTEEFEVRFGSAPVKYFGLLIVGRSETLTPRERRRRLWRQDKTVVNSKHIRCLAFDELAADLTLRLSQYPRSAKAEEFGQGAP
jgi:hypothetical protein